MDGRRSRQQNFTLSPRSVLWIATDALPACACAQGLTVTSPQKRYTKTRLLDVICRNLRTTRPRGGYSLRNVNGRNGIRTVRRAVVRRRRVVRGRSVRGGCLGGV